MGAWTAHLARDCGNYRIFLEEPDAALPKFALVAGTPDVPVLPDYVPAQMSNAAFIRQQDSWAGQLNFSLPVTYAGPYVVQIDPTAADNDWSNALTLADTRTIGGTANTNISLAFDGKDGSAVPIPLTQAVRARIIIGPADEIHFALVDDEGFGPLMNAGPAATLQTNGYAGFLGGWEIEQLKGSLPGNTTIYWNDCGLPPAGVVLGPSGGLTSGGGDCNAILADGVATADEIAGSDSTGSIHGWPSTNGNLWGDNRLIDNWAFGETVEQAFVIRIAKDLTGAAAIPLLNPFTLGFMMLALGAAALVSLRRQRG
jgi:hypothetical protein